MLLSNIEMVLLACLHIPLIGSVRPDGYQLSLQTDENIVLQICKMKHCFDGGLDCSFQKFMEWLMQIDKYGECPAYNTSSVAGNGCVDSCRGHDYRCLGIQKCCSHICGSKCMNPMKLETISDRTLPPIPQNITITNLERHRNIAEITWKMYYTDTPTYSFVVLEARSHIGYYYDEQKLSNWFSIAFEVTSSAMKYQRDKGGLMMKEFGANVRLRPGRWYQFRMSAINGNGTRGYSASSPNFQLKDQVPPQLLKNNTVYTKAVWKPPRTSYPIDKYRIAWSLYLDSNNNGSLWQNEAFVLEPARHFEFWSLKQNSLYYLQIQALSSFGKKRSLKSAKESLLLNTSISSNTTIGHFRRSSTEISNQDAKADVTVRFVCHKKFGFLVRVSWPVQLIVSFIELCSGELDCLTKQTTKDLKLIRPKKGHFDFIGLKFSTKYSLRLRKGGRVIFSKTIVTPSCSRFLKKHPICLIQCT